MRNKRDRRSGLLMSDKIRFVAKLETAMQRWLEGVTNKAENPSEHGQLTLKSESEEICFTLRPGTLTNLNNFYRKLTGSFYKLLPPMYRERSQRSNSRHEFNVDREADKAMRLYGHPSIAASELKTWLTTLDEQADALGEAELYDEMYNRRGLHQVISELERRAKGETLRGPFKYSPNTYDLARALKRFGRPMVPAVRRRQPRQRKVATNAK